MFFATVSMVGLSVLLRDKVIVENLKISENGYDPTIPTARGWFVSPLGVHTTLSIWAVLGAVLPATLVHTVAAVHWFIISYLLGIHTDIC